MIIIDGTQLSVAALAIAMGANKKNFKQTAFTKELGRYAILNSIRANIKRFKSEYAGSLGTIIAFDASKPWRKEVFPYYKAHRAKARDESLLNWNVLHEVKDMVRDELLHNFPLKTLFVDRAEADDIIAVLTKKAVELKEPTVIVGSDKDFRQLLWYDDLDTPVKQWCIREKRFIGCNDPRLFLKELIINGDKSDGIPNILSADNCIVIGKKQSPMFGEKLEMFLNNPPSEYKEEHLRNFKRNEQLISFEHIPQDVITAILEADEKAKPQKRSMLPMYFMKHDLRDLMEKANEF